MSSTASEKADLKKGKEFLGKGQIVKIYPVSLQLSIYIFGKLIGDSEGKLSCKNVYLDRPDLSQKVFIDFS